MPGPIRLVLLGAGGHASDVLGVIEALNAGTAAIEILGLLDDDSNADMSRFASRGVERLGGLDLLTSLDASWVAAVGWPSTRRLVVMRAMASGRAAATLVSPLADIGAGVVIDPGVVVLGGARVSPCARLGPHALVSYLAAVGHDTVVGEGASVMPGAMLSGGVRVGAYAMIGTNATVIEGIAVGEGATVGAGAVVVVDVPAGTTVVGVPARSVEP